MFLLDTDTVIYALKGHATVTENLRIHLDDPMYLSTITMMELYYGAFKSQNIDANLAKLSTLENSFPLLVPGPETVASFGKLKAKLESQGIRLADLDLIISVTAIAHNLTLISNNQKHFARIPGLKLANWL